jgi:hypothetical protein
MPDAIFDAVKIFVDDVEITPAGASLYRARIFCAPNH